MKFLTLSVILSFAACLVFAAVCLILNCLGYTVSDTLIEWFFKVFGVEFAAAAAIKISNHIIKKDEIKDRIRNIKENNLEVEKKDLTPSNQNQGYYYTGDDYGGDEFGDTMG
jgi:hypothetical protein